MTHLLNLLKLIFLLQLSSTEVPATTWNDICDHPEFGVNGFRKAGVLDAIVSITES